MNADEILSHFDGVKPVGPDKWMAFCSAHDEKTPSLSLRWVGDRMMVHDFGGCSTEDVLSHAGLRFSDLFLDSLPKSERRRRAKQHSRAELEAALSHELTVLQLVLSPRIASRQNTGNNGLKHFRPEVRPYPAEHWERELLAVHRIRNGLEALYAI